MLSLRKLASTEERTPLLQNVDAEEKIPFQADVDLENQAPNSLFGYSGISGNQEENILSFLTPPEWACMLAVNSYWNDQINTLIRHNNRLRNQFFDLLTHDAKKIAKAMREKLGSPLNAAPNAFSTLRTLYQSQNTQAVAEAEPVYPGGTRFLVNWLAAFHNAMFANERPRICPKDICHRSIIPLFLCISGAITSYILAEKFERNLSAILSMRTIYGEIDYYLTEHTIRTSGNPGCEAFLEALRNGIYGTMSDYRHIDRNQYDPNCGADMDSTSFITDECKSGFGQYLSFSYTPYTSELHELTDRCGTISHKINDLCNDDLLYTPTVGTCVNPPTNIARFAEWSYLGISLLLLLYWVNRSGIFQAARNTYANFSMSRFFSKNKSIIREAEGLSAWNEKLEKKDVYKKIGNK